MASLNKNIDVIAVSEIWDSIKSPIATNININGYNFLDKSIQVPLKAKVEELAYTLNIHWWLALVTILKLLGTNLKRFGLK